MMNETLLAFFQRNRIHDTFPLHHFQTRLNDFPFRAVNHNRHTRNIWFGRNQIQEFCHSIFAIQHPFVHIHIDNLSAPFYLLARNIQRLIVFLFLYQSKKFSRTRHIGSFPHIHKYAFRRDD